MYTTVFLPHTSRIFKFLIGALNITTFLDEFQLFYK